MTARGLLLIAAACGLAVGTPASAQRAPAPVAPPSTSKPGAPATRSAALPPPIAFFVARGDANACGPGCREWIAAEGTIDPDADDRLRAFLNKLGSRRLPVFFHSPGGSVPAGLAIGRLMRAHGLTAGVGWTVPAGCDPKQQREVACDKLKRSGRELVATLDTGHAMCNSSCVYALVGAAVREVGAGIGLGVHSSSITYTLSHVDAGGRVTRTPTHVAPTVERRALESGYERIGAYLREMGISQGLLAAAREVEYSHLKFLTRDQLVAFGIDRRAVVQGLWWFVDASSSASAIKVIEESRAGTFRRDVLRLTCRNATTLRLQYGRDIGAGATISPVRLRVVAKAGSFLLGSVVKTNGSHGPMEVRSVDLPLAALADATFIIEPAGPARSAEPVVRLGNPRGSAPAADATAAVAQIPDLSIARVTVQSAGPGLGDLLRRCGNAAPVRPETASERI